MTDLVGAGLRWEQDPDLHAPLLDGAEEPRLLGLQGAAAQPLLGSLEGTVEDCAAVARVLRAASFALTEARDGRPTAPLDLRSLPQSAARLLAETLRTGEVSAVISAGTPYQIEETALTGLWRVRAQATDGALVADHLEAGDVPLVLHAAAEALTSTDFEPPEPGASPGNALPVLAEIRHWMRTWRPGMPNHVISLTLLPMTEDDLRLLGRVIGGGAIRAFSRGYGSVRASLTRARGVWQVEYLNVQDKVVVDSIEVGGIPAAIRAATEDFEDSLERLEAILETCAA